MDQELIAYLDERFRETSQQMQALSEKTTQQFQDLREETAQQFQDLRGETSQQIQGLREEATQQNQSLRQEFQDFREETTRRFEQVDQGARHTHILIEAARGDIRQVAEGVVGMDERLGFLRTDLKQDIQEVRSLIPPLYKDLDMRLRVLEVRKDLQGRDPVEVVRERFGKQSE
ncbi:MAG TPA: hypothetical protein VKK31_13080 [Thermoanaerobaculia bacterium]|nr:hypothetical protein [Thermoanaerobaculia bacterium]